VFDVFLACAHCIQSSALCLLHVICLCGPHSEVDCPYVLWLKVRYELGVFAAKTNAVVSTVQVVMERRHAVVGIGWVLSR
jgi:hypothetical protein